MLNRRELFKGSGQFLTGAGGSLAFLAEADPKETFNIELIGLKPDATKDQTSLMQKAFNQASKDGKKLLLPGGTFVCKGLTLPSNLHVEGVQGQTVLKFNGGPGFFIAQNQKNIFLSHLVIDGRKEPLANDQVTGLLTFHQCEDVLLSHCIIKNSAKNGLTMSRTKGKVLFCTAQNCEHAGLMTLDGVGVEFISNHIFSCANNGILVWRSQKGADGTLVAHNRIEQIAEKGGGSGQNGNGINVYRAGNVVVSNNVITDCAFSAVRNNSGDQVQILNNNCSNLGEVAIYSEFSFEGAVIANNMVDGAHVGISVTNFNEGGRLATVSGNLIRNIKPLHKTRQGQPGIGIGVEADSIVTGNVVEHIDGIGIGIGWGQYLREVSANNNIVRYCNIGIGVSGDEEAGFALIATNMISHTKNGGIRAMDFDKTIGPDLAKSSAESFRHLAIYGNVSL